MKKRDLIRHILGYTSGIFVFIVLIPSAFLFISRTFDKYFPAVPIQGWIKAVPVIFFFITGIFFIVSSNLMLFFKGLGGPADVFNIAISPRTKKLVITGVYRYTRNPMVFGAFTLYCAVSLYLESLPCLILLISGYFFAVLYIKQTEEKRLLQDFGKAYTAYKKKVPMIIPFLKF